MYLREMGAVELLSREGEIAIAKRIEAGRDTMIWGLCESPITFNAIIGWSERPQRRPDAAARDPRPRRDAVARARPPSRSTRPRKAAKDGEGEISEKTAGPTIKEEEEVADEPEADANEDDEDMVERRTAPQAEEEDEDNTLSLAQMEEALKPQALEKFADITSLFKKFAKLQAHRIDALQAGQRIPRRRGEEVPEAARAAHRRGRERPVPRHQDRVLWSTSSTPTTAA